MSEMITKNHALVAQFGDTLDRLLDGIENLVANSRPTLGGERFLTDREVSARLKVSRRTLQDYSVGWKDSLQGIGHRKDACRQLPRSIQACRHIMPAVP